MEAPWWLWCERTAREVVVLEARVRFPSVTLSLRDLHGSPGGRHATAATIRLSRTLPTPPTHPCRHSLSSASRAGGRAVDGSGLLTRRAEAPSLVRIQPCTLEGPVGESGRPRRVVSAEITGSNPVRTAASERLDGPAGLQNRLAGVRVPPDVLFHVHRGVAQRPGSSLTSWPTWVRFPPPLSSALEGPRSTKPRVGGSTPPGGIHGDVAESGKAPALQAEDCGFESHRLHQAEVAQRRRARG